LGALYNIDWMVVFLNKGGGVARYELRVFLAAAPNAPSAMFLAQGKLNFKKTSL